MGWGYVFKNCLPIFWLFGLVSLTHTRTHTHTHAMHAMHARTRNARTQCTHAHAHALRLSIKNLLKSIQNLCEYA